MALSFPNATDRVECGSNAVLDNLTKGTYAAWIYPNGITSDSRIVQKGLAASGIRNMGIDGASGAGKLYVYAYRPTIVLMISSTGLVTDTTWQFVAGTFDSTLTDNDQHLYRGTLTSAVTEAATYSARTVGSGALGDNSATNQSIGNRAPAGAYPFLGVIAWVGIWNRQLSLGELQAQQFRPHVTSGCVLFMHLGYAGTGTQPDWSGNGNNGTVTGATVSAHVPLRPVFGANAWTPYIPPVVVGNPWYAYAQQ